ncbi:MAG TPA: hypothetical protein VFH47_01010, partial [Candidatus Thermoplasmatota archaeon]|nr:hypothetical protein [Candidatus Thermoplasmatota archaeon]
AVPFAEPKPLRPIDGFASDVADVMEAVLPAKGDVWVMVGQNQYVDRTVWTVRHPGSGGGLLYVDDRTRTVYDQAGWNAWRDASIRT